MNLDLPFTVTELQRRLMNLVTLGRIQALDSQGVIPKAKVQIGELTTTWLPLMVTRAGADRSGWLPVVGEQVVVLSPNGELSQGIILGSLNQRDYPSAVRQPGQHRIDYADGARLVYDREQHHMQLSLPAGATLDVTAKGGIRIRGDLRVEGSVTATEQVQDKRRSMEEDRTLFNQHIHAGIKPGPKTTEPPQPQQ